MDHHETDELMDLQINMALAHNLSHPPRRTKIHSQQRALFLASCLAVMHLAMRALMCHLHDDQRPTLKRVLCPWPPAWLRCTWP
mmetsp:Transcript_20345/g.56696  ORF Transcript_20345/g.56696 Transcript_20345/m.56696 type:complete len:84 (-) Transcript_20345:2306-2557(-)